MNKDLNPLSDLETYTTYHILVAFQYSEDAYSYNYRQEFGKNGTRFNAGCGEGMVLINELKDSNVSVTSASTEWSFFSPTDFRTSSYTGTIHLADRSSFFFTQCVKEFTVDMGMSITHLTFAWIPMFIGRRDASSTDETIRPNPMFFHVSKFSQNVGAIAGRLYMFDIVGCYNSHGLSPQFNQLNHMTLNHKDGNTINSIPTPTAPSSGIKSTMEEDAAKLRARQSRLQKAKYMKNVQDACASLEANLNDQKNDHKRQLQRFMALIRNDYSEKIPEMRRGDPLPIDYGIKVSDYYKNKKLDNMNLPFEQVEVDQSSFGLSTITIPANNTIHNALSTIMRMSKDIGRDHSKLPVKTYKFTTVTKRKCDGKYLIHTNVNDYVSPYNGEPDSDSPDTSPGNGLVSRAIEYTYQDLGGTLSEDNTILGITYTSTPPFSLKPIEIVSDAPDTQAVFGDREPVSLRRASDYSSFFENAYSGIKAFRGNMIDNGLQNSEAAKAIAAFNPHQQTSYTLTVVGNPHLLSDINRNPQDVIDMNPANAIIYKNVEFEPMYIKLKVYLAGDRLVRNQGAFYYEGMLHIYKIVNVFTPGSFTQMVHCARTVEKM